MLFSRVAQKPVFRTLVRVTASSLDVQCPSLSQKEYIAFRENKVSRNPSKTTLSNLI